VALRHDAPLPVALDGAVRREIDGATLLAFLQANEFRALIGRIEQVADAHAADRAAKARDAGSDAPVYATITQMAELEALLAQAAAVGRLSIDTETTSLNVARAELVGVSLAVEDGGRSTCRSAMSTISASFSRGSWQMALVLERLRPVLADPGILKIGHNLKYDIAVLEKYAVPITPADDTMLLSYVLDGASHGHGMDELALRHLEHETIPYEAVCGKGAKQIGFASVPIDKATEYAAEDALVTLRLWQLLKRRLLDERVTTVYETLERPMLPILAAMETAGIRVDRHRLETLSSEFGQRMAEREEAAIRLAGRPFNLGSPKQLGEILYDEMGLGGGKKTKTGAFATGADILEELAAQGHPLPQVVLDWRQLQKLTRTYTEALVEEIVPATGRVHTCYMMAATSTGRLSSTEPNLQNIPIRTEEGRKIREAFVAEDGHVLVSADYSQIELRVLAHMADIQALKEAFARDTDIHSVTAARMFKVPEAEVGGELRRRAKMINYGIIYGIGAFGLAQRLGIPQGEAKAFIEAYFDEYPGVRDYMERAKAEAREHGFVTTLFGRRCFVPEIASKQPARRSYAERQAINAPIQGSAADIMKRAMRRVDRALKAEAPEVRMLLQVHDELVFEAPENAVEPAKALVKSVMEGAAALDVPLVVDVGAGANWGVAH
jgi:DNA polymerase I